MSTVTGYTATRMQEIEDNAIVNGEVSGDDLILYPNNGTPINAGNVRGLTGATGPTGPAGAPGSAGAMGLIYRNVITGLPLANRQVAGTGTPAQTTVFGPITLNSSVLPAGISISSARRYQYMINGVVNIEFGGVGGDLWVHHSGTATANLWQGVAFMDNQSISLSGISHAFKYTVFPPPISLVLRRTISPGYPTELITLQGTGFGGIEFMLYDVGSNVA